MGGSTADGLWARPKPRTRRDSIRASDREVKRVAKGRILVVDDDRLVLSNTAAVLEDLGHTVHTAASGEEALTRLEQGREIDLIVTDQLMPGMTGLQLVASARERWPGLPCLLVSGFAELTPEEAGQCPVLAKPFTQAQLAEAVQNLSAQRNVIRMRRRR